MKLFDRIIFYLFLIHILTIVVQFASLPFFILNPELIESFMFGEKRELYHKILMPLALTSTSFWVYCLWFYMKYDSRSNKWFLLLFFNWIYAPIYYYEVKIKKRPLMGHDNKADFKENDNGITDSEFIELTRDNIIQVLSLWASRTEQLELQNSIPKSEVTSELFDYWCDYSMADSEVLNETFKPEELELLSEFDKEISSVENKYKFDSCNIEEFQQTSEWNSLSQLAKDISRKLNKENTIGNKSNRCAST